jgi:hypothetical protein
MWHFYVSMSSVQIAVKNWLFVQNPTEKMAAFYEQHL